MKKIIFEVIKMELADIRNELEKTAKILADFRGSL